jgi:hypothetical protein
MAPSMHILSVPHALLMTTSSLTEAPAHNFEYCLLFQAILHIPVHVCFIIYNCSVTLYAGLQLSVRRFSCTGR